MDKPTATLIRCRIEVPRPVRGKPSYTWVDGLTVKTPDGKELAPPMRINEAKDFCRRQGWDFVILNP